MLLCYVQMGRVLWGHQAIGEENISTKKSRKTKQKVCDLLLLLHQTVTLLADREDVRPDGGSVRSVLASLPLLLPLLLPQPKHYEGQPLGLLSSLEHVMLQAWYTPHMYMAFYWLAMSTCCVNPLVYYAMNKR